MATASPGLLRPPTPPIEPLSDEDASSPLSEVEEPDQGEEMGRDDDMSDANDTEAETERLYDTPQNDRRRQGDVVMNQFGERTPTKLRQEQSAQELGATKDDEDELLSEESGSVPSSPPAPIQDAVAPAGEQLQSPTLDLLAEAAANQDNDSKKRKRSQLPGNLEVEHPRKRITDTDGDTAMVEEDEEPLANTTSGEHSADESAEAIAPEVEDDHNVPATAPESEAQAEEKASSRKQTRSGSKKRKGLVGEREEPPEGAPDGVVAEDDGTHTGEDDNTIEADIDEEAEAAHRTEEELERKRLAYEQLHDIEKRFTNFREKLHRERVEQLEEEERQLRLETPTHPEYLKMMACINQRRDEKIRIADRELELKREALGRYAVARRSQIHGQYFQGIRESRERTLAELGQQFYNIQNARRKQASNVPDFTLRYPENQSQRVRNALAYNKEVSILSGIAKYEGMPAAPDMRGASLQDQDDDFEAINRARVPVPAQQRVPRSIYVDYGGPFGQGALGPAAVEWFEQTPWANPGRPSQSHLTQRQNSGHHESRKRSPQPEALARRHSHQHIFSSSTISSSSNHVAAVHPPNGNFVSHKNPPRMPTNSPEVTRAASMLEQTSARSRAAAAAAALEQGPAVKHETATPIGGF